MSGINWPNSSAPNKKPPTDAFANLTIKPSPFSSRNVSPVFGASTNKSGSGSDSFANLTPFGKAKQNANLSLLEQQKLLQEQKRKQEAEKQKQMNAMFGGGGAGWDSLANMGSPTPKPAAMMTTTEDDDLFAAFNAAAPVDSSSHYPPPTTTMSTTKSRPIAHNTYSIGDDFDLLGDGSVPLKQAPSTNTAYPSFLDPFENPPSRRASARNTPQPQFSDDDDILGDLGKPVSEVVRPQPTPSPQLPVHSRSRSPEPTSDPRDPAIAEIMDMGFSAEQAKHGLSKTETGLDVEQAVGWLLEKSHRESRPTSTNPDRASSRSRHDDSSSRTQHRGRQDTSTPAWARSRSETPQKDITAVAVDVGSTLFKQANSLWSAGRKKVEKAVAEFQVDLADGGNADLNMPKWMRERQIREQLEAHGAKGITRNDRPMAEARDRNANENVPEITDEAMMLEMDSGPPRKAWATPSSSRNDLPPSRPDSRARQQFEYEQREREHRQRQQVDAFTQQREHEMRSRQMAAHTAYVIPDSVTRKAKLAADADAAPVYVSSKRRRPPPASSLPSKPSTPEPDLLNGNGAHSATPSTSNPFARDAAAGRFLDSHHPPTAKPRSTPMPTPPIRRTAPPKRPEVPLSAQALAASNSARAKGTEAFKRGDYTAAQLAYTSSIECIPEAHLLRIILLSNRSLCTFKIGDPKSALSDVDAILSHIGESRGADETIELDGTAKKMSEYWGKAVIRRAECLEQLERWTHAKEAWSLAVSAGVGGAVASTGKRRCETALNPKPPPSSASAAPKPSPSLRPKPTIPKPPGREAQAAVAALRQTNAANERAEAEKLQLYDIVEARVGAWKAGKEGNLRALIAGLDTVLWEGSGWKKVGMAELLVPARCKVQYMKGIAKVHPDKIRPDATTEQRMISAAVFSLLNESWDKFKAENGL